MRSVPTTSLDLTAADVVADPYPFFAAERRRAPGGLARAVGDVPGLRRTPRSARCSATGGWAGSGATASRADYLEPFNLLHRNQMMENEPPEHTRLRRPVAAGVRARARRAAAARGCGSWRPRCSPRSTRPASTSIADYAEPLPVLVIAELLGVPRVARATTCATGRRRSCGCTRSRPSAEVVDAAVARGRPTSPAWSASWSPSAAPSPGRRPDHRPGRPPS